MDMVTLTAEVTEELRKITKDLVKEGMYKSQSEVIRDAIRQLAIKYKSDQAPSIEKIREIVSKASKKSGKTLSQTLLEIRGET